MTDGLEAEEEEYLWLQEQLRPLREEHKGAEPPLRWRNGTDAPSATAVNGSESGPDSPGPEML